MKQPDFVKIFKALANEQRLQLFRYLYQWEMRGTDRENADKCCEGIHKAFTKACECMDLSRSTVSHHIKELQNAGLVTCSRDGQAVICKINRDIVESIRNFLL